MRRRPELVEKCPERMKRRPELQLSWRRTPGGGQWRPLREYPKFWTPHKHGSGVHFHSIPDSGRHTKIAVASDSASSPILDATSTWQWRPFPLHSQFWTPRKHDSGVHFHSIPDSGRHTNLTMVQVASKSCKIDSTLLVYLVKPLL